MKYDLVGFGYGLVAMALLFPSFNGVIGLFAEDSAMASAAVVVQWCCLAICLVLTRLAKKFSLVSFALSATMGIALFTLTRFALMEVRFLSYTAAILLIGIAVWSALETGNRRTAKTSSSLR